MINADVIELFGVCNRYRTTTTTPDIEQLLGVVVVVRYLLVSAQFLAGAMIICLVGLFGLCHRYWSFLFVVNVMLPVFHR